MISAFNKSCMIDWSKSSYATGCFLSSAGLFYTTGLSFKLAYKMMNICKNKIKNIQNLMAFTNIYDATNNHSGEWGKIAPFKETLVNDTLKKGDLWAATMYLLWITYVKIDQGNFDIAQRQIDKLSEIAVTYDYNLASVYADIQTTYLLLKKGLLSEAQKKAEQAIIFSGRHGMEIQRQVFFCRRAQAQILLNDIDGAKESLLNARKTIDQHKYLFPVLIMQYFIAQFMSDIYLLKERIVSNDSKNLSELKKNAHHSGKRAMNNSKKFAVHSVEALRLMGEYYWLIGKQKKALKWWDKAIKKGEELEARPDLSRTYFEIGKSLREPISKHKELNDTSAGQL